MPLLSIVIVNYNTFALTCQCIQSVYDRVIDLAIEIIVVDNGSSECSPKNFLKDFPNLQLIELKDNVGFARGNNAGIEVAKAPVLLLLNSDTKVFDASIQKTYYFLVGESAVGVVGCKLINEDGSEQLSSYIPIRYPILNFFIGGNLLLQKLISVSGLFKKYSDHMNSVKEYQKKNHVCEAVSGAFMMVKKEVVQTCGAFDPDFFLYCEETEWCRNRIEKNYKIMYYAEASVIHYGGKSSRSALVHKQMMLSSFLYNYKIGWGFYSVIFLITAINSCVNLFVLPFLKKDTYQIIVRQLRAFVDVIPYIFFEIPRYKNAYGSRPEPLMIKEYREKA